MCYYFALILAVFTTVTFAEVITDIGPNGKMAQRVRYQKSYLSNPRGTHLLLASLDNEGRDLVSLDPIATDGLLLQWWEAASKKPEDANSQEELEKLELALKDPQNARLTKMIEGKITKLKSQTVNVSEDFADFDRWVAKDESIDMLWDDCSESQRENLRWVASKMREILALHWSVSATCSHAYTLHHLLSSQTITHSTKYVIQVRSSDPGKAETQAKRTLQDKCDRYCKSGAADPGTCSLGAPVASKISIF